MRTVLRYLAEHLSSSTIRRVETPFVVDEMPFDGRVAPALRRLAKAQPPYIEGIAVAEADYPIVITDLTERGWEGAEAAGDRRDAAPGAPASTPGIGHLAQRGHVSGGSVVRRRATRPRAARLRAARGRRVNRPGDSTLLRRQPADRTLGHEPGGDASARVLEDSSSVVLFISRECAAKVWPIAERRATLSRALRERREYVLPVRFDDTVLPGLDANVSYLKAGDYSPEQLAAAIAEKLVSLGIAVPANQGATVGWAERRSDAAAQTSPSTSPTTPAREHHAPHQLAQRGSPEG